MSADRFYRRIEEPERLGHAALVGLFAYYLTVELGQEIATVSEVRQCYIDCDLTPSTRLSSYFSEGLKSRPQKFVKSGAGYKLQRHYREELGRSLGARDDVLQTSAELRRLEKSLPAGPKRAFLEETIVCFEAGANRAAIVMCWMLCIDHLFDHVLKHQLASFNAALASNPDKRVKVVTARQDLSELSESKFIETLRAANIISNDVRKILEQKLGTRNSAAHPSGITIGKTKTIDFVEDLTTNVLLAFAV